MRCDEDLLHGDASKLATYLGVHVRTVKRWKAGKQAMPEPVRRLLALRFEGDASALLGDAWQGFYFQQGELYIPGWRYGFNPHQIKGMFFQVQEVRALYAQIREMKQAQLGRDFVRGLISAALNAQGPGDAVRLGIGDNGHEADA